MSTEIDEYGELEAWKQENKTKISRHEFLKKKLSKLDAGIHDGETWRLFLTPKTWTGLDQQRLKDEGLYDSYCTSKPYNEVTVTKL